MVRAFLFSIFLLSVIFLHLSGFENLSGVKDTTSIRAKIQTFGFFLNFVHFALSS